MSTTVPWSQILAAADAAARFIPHPAGGVVSIALAIARALVDDGCTVDGCPADIKARLQPADIPAEDVAFFKARGEAEARVRGLDKSSISAALARPIRGPMDLVNREAEGLPPVSSVTDLRDYAAEIEADDTDEGDGPKGAA
jgi:hypothetical protein